MQRPNTKMTSGIGSRHGRFLESGIGSLRCLRHRGSFDAADALNNQHRLFEQSGGTNMNKLYKFNSTRPPAMHIDFKLTRLLCCDPKLLFPCANSHQPGSCFSPFLKTKSQASVGCIPINDIEARGHWHADDPGAQPRSCAGLAPSAQFGLGSCF